MPKVSVIIPAYNREKLLPRAILSVLSQTYKDFELIIVDDYSTDKTREVIKKFEEKDTRVRPVFLKDNSGGPAYPKNAGLPFAKGEYIAYLDSDDQWLPEKLERQMKLFEIVKDENIGLVSCNSYEINERGPAKGISATPKISKSLTDARRHGITIASLDEKSFPTFKRVFYRSLRDVFMYPEFYGSNNSGMIFPRKVIDAIGPRDVALTEFEDTDVLFRLAEASYNFYFIDEPLFKVYMHGENTGKAHEQYSRKHALKRGNEFALLLERHSFHENIPALYSGKLRGVGELYMIGGASASARKYFLKAARVDPFDFKNYVHFILSFFGADLYRSLFVLRNKIF
ncbi:MAG: glycosyltransferase [Candidatus Brennerbacteria bacterium]